MHFTSTDGAASLPANYTFVAGDSGVHTFTNAYTLKTVGSQTITATDTVTGTITGTSAGDHGQPGRRIDPRALGDPGLGHRRHHRLGHRHRQGRVRQHRHRLPRHRPLQRAPTAPQSLPANYTFVAGDTGAHTFTTPTR